METSQLHFEIIPLLKLNPESSFAPSIRLTPFEFHISKAARDKYNFDEGLFSISGNVILSNFQAVRLFAQKMNEKEACLVRDLKNHSKASLPEQTIKAGQLNAMGLLDEILHYVISLYCGQKNKQVKVIPLEVIPPFNYALKWVAKHFSFEVVDKTLTRFVELFPPLAVYQKKVSVEEYVGDKTQDSPNLEIAAEEMVLLFLANNNPACLPFIELFDDTELERGVSYEVFIGSIIDFFKTQPTFGPQNQFLIDMLRAPVVACPNCLFGQLEYIKNNWGMLIPQGLLDSIGLSLDLLKEEEKSGFIGAGPSLIPYFEGSEYEEFENFSQDLDWMSNVVLLAKNAYVWLDQLSKKYWQSITRLDQVPDEELDILAKWGFTGLWLIGLWERSPASQRIKQLCGNPEAIASAYSVYDYVIAEDLGGEAALENLKFRAWQRGIRLASDMVPNHMGIYSKWLIEHPDWFIQLDYPPFPSYNFTGQNLSWDPRVGIYLEDGYWRRTDAAVVFKRVDHWTGDVKYIYHGNDGTSMPWNDTAQLNFLHQDVREAVIQTILHVARKFPIIRFDAAMTLTKKHYQRLWFPQPGSGGDIPSRAGQGMSKADFDNLFSNEFWREVVDRIAREVPDTLLLAEAFWLMEGYFVRTLGMHRVYNSAFMNMLKMEENANYRSVIKNVLEFNPEILKRFVNFMNNPDEHTAVAQFGKGDKYFGIAGMMVTMPGLPMFGHGQIEGWTEKYGMEYTKAYWDEEVDLDLVLRHEAEVFPLMRKRHLFSGVENFVLYDFYAPEGFVNEDVFAYSNRVGDERAIIVYHNKYASAKGWIHTSSGISVEGAHPGQRRLIQKTLAEALGIRADGQHYYIFKDYKAGLEYIRSGKELTEQGLYVELGSYHYHIFLNFREVCDDRQGYYARLTTSLNGCGVPNMEEAYKEICLEPILTPFKQVMNKDMLMKLAGLCTETNQEVLTHFEQNMTVLLRKIKEFVGGSPRCGNGDEVEIVNEVMNLLSAILRLERLSLIRQVRQVSENEEYNSALSYLQSGIYKEDSTHLPLLRVLFSWVIIYGLGKAKSESGYEQRSADWMDEWLLGKIVGHTFAELGCDEHTAGRETHLLRILTTWYNWFKGLTGLTGWTSRIEAILDDPKVASYLNFNRHQDILWLSKEALEELMYWLFATTVVHIITANEKNEKGLQSKIIKCHKIVVKVLESAEKSGYQVKEMLDLCYKL
ncbi:MAG: alpha-amylase family glycosyl hydrolase [Nitrospirota bacterium]